MRNWTRCHLRFATRNSSRRVKQSPYITQIHPFDRIANIFQEIEIIWNKSVPNYITAHWNLWKPSRTKSRLMNYSRRYIYRLESNNVPANRLRTVMVTKLTKMNNVVRSSPANDFISIFLPDSTATEVRFVRQQFIFRCSSTEFVRSKSSRHFLYRKDQATASFENKRKRLRTTWL